MKPYKTLWKKAKQRQTSTFSTITVPLAVCNYLAEDLWQNASFSPEQFPSFLLQFARYCELQLVLSVPSLNHLTWKRKMWNCSILTSLWTTDTWLYTFNCHLFLTERHEIFMMGVSGVSKMAQPYPKIWEKVQWLTKMRKILEHYPSNSEPRMCIANHDLVPNVFASKHCICFNQAWKIGLNRHELVWD